MAGREIIETTPLTTAPVCGHCHDIFGAGDDTCRQCGTEISHGTIAMLIGRYHITYRVWPWFPWRGRREIRREFEPLNDIDTQEVIIAPLCNIVTFFRLLASRKKKV